VRAYENGDSSRLVGIKGTADLIESRRLETHTGKLSFFHLTLQSPDGWAHKSSHGVGPGRLLQDGDEEADVSLSRLTVKSGSALWGK
jgi:hypothetical protein